MSDEVSFTAGITFTDDRVETVDVVAIGGGGMTYEAAGGERKVVTWPEVKAVMLATTDHMLESAGAMFTMAERLDAAGDPGGQESLAMRRFGLGVLSQAAPRMCPLGAGCGLRPGWEPPQAESPSEGTGE